MIDGCITFVLVREGHSDDGLIPHLADLIVRSGGIEAIGQPSDYSGTVTNKLRQLDLEDIDIDIVFVHRDADRAGPSARRGEIAQAIEASGCSTVVVPVIPVQELEAWLLVDEAALRGVVGRPMGRTGLGLPKASAIETTSSPKEVLRSALLAASESTGRRRAQETHDFEKRRRALLDRLDIDGPVRQLPAWRRLEADVAAAVATLLPG